MLLKRIIFVSVISIAFSSTVGLTVHWVTTEYDRQQYASVRDQALDDFDSQLSAALDAQQAEFDEQFNQQNQDFVRQLKAQKKAFDRKLTESKREAYLMGIYNVCWVLVEGKLGPDQATMECVPYVQEGAALIRKLGYEPKPGWEHVLLNEDLLIQ